MKKLETISSRYLPKGNWVSSLNAIEKAIQDKIPLKVTLALNVTHSSLVAVFLSCPSSDLNLCVPWRMDIDKSKPEIGNVHEPSFGDVYFSDGSFIKLSDGSFFELSLWEAPTRFFIT